MINVYGKRYNAHRSILNARSLVLMVKLFFGPTMDYDVVAHLRIDDVEPRVFEALLHFIYIDKLPEIDDYDKAKMAQRLHAVVDRYDLQGLKVICEDVLLGNIDARTVADLSQELASKCKNEADSAILIAELKDHVKVLESSSGVLDDLNKQNKN
ncbi:hypothetical protein PR202_ga31284 [Eleusine coracana subsp. coracana]|uniref:BTB domain-containing protein n=1 Tax=Eleusine coracana subsp. coracana TaxID=191504 RepID=A0AAV5DSR6_ELECO|nr:hypothetical protein PR202_ga31284 [Eleusine coracana subsp. coracana]